MPSCQLALLGHPEVQNFRKMGHGGYAFLGTHRQSTHDEGVEVRFQNLQELLRRHASLGRDCFSAGWIEGRKAPAGGQNIIESSFAFAKRMICSS